MLFAIALGLAALQGLPAAWPAIASANDDDRPTYLWPIDEPHQLTSSFGEFRWNHFHGGIDFSTEQKNGRAVYAIADGWVWRVRASGVGYGRSIYARLADGRTAVYAHLDSFADPIQDFVATAQESLGRYEVDLYPGPGRLPIRAGDVIARSGSSGAGPPHLHFEIREGSGADTGLNPLTFGYVAVDSLAPIIDGLWLRPYGPGATVDGSLGTARASPRLIDGRYRLDREPVISGAALVTLRTHDPSGAGNSLAPFRATLFVDGKPHYSIRFERFDWLRAREVELAFDASLPRRFNLNLFCPPGASGPTFGGRPPLDGILSTAPPAGLAPGRHDIR